MLDCDRGRPCCKVCEKHNISHLCHYDPRLWESKLETHDGKETTRKELMTHTLNSVDTTSTASPIDSPPKVNVKYKSYLNRILNTNLKSNCGPILNTDTAPKSNMSSAIQEIKQKINQLEASITHDSRNLNDIQPPQPHGNRELYLIREYGANSNDTVDFFNDPPAMLMWCSRMNNHGPLSWIALVMKDPFLMPIHRKVVGRRKKNSLSVPEYIKAKIVPETVKDAEFSRQIMDDAGMSEMGPMNLAGLKDSILAGTNKTLEAQILKVLPPTKAIWMLVDRFFLYVYPFFPYLDKKEFISQVEQITGSRTSKAELAKGLHFRKKLDIATIGTLLIVLRMAYMTLANNHEKATDFPKPSADEAYLLQYLVGSETIKVAQFCLNQFHLLRRCALNVFQCAALMRDYQRIDGSDGFGDAEQQIYLGTLIQIAVSIGLNRDPSKFDPAVSSSRLGNLWRKIWYVLICHDIEDSAIFGTPIMSRPDFFDTRPPSFSQATSNTDNLDVERETVEGIISGNELCKVLGDVVNSVLDIRNPPGMGDLLLRLDRLETYTKQHWGSLLQILTLNDGIHAHNLRKMNAIISYITVQSTLHPVYYHIFLLYEKKHNTEACFKFAEKILKIVIEIVSHFVEMIRYSYRYVGKGFDYLLSPPLETAIQKCLQIQISLYMRSMTIRKSIGKGSITSEIATDIDAFMSRLMSQNFGEKYLQGLMPVSGRSFYAWRMMKATSFIFKLLQKDKFSYPPDQYNFLAELKPDKIRYLWRLTETDRYTTKQKQLWRCENVRKSSEEMSDTFTPAPETTSSTTTSHSSLPATVPLATSTSLEMSLEDIDKFWAEMLRQQKIPIAGVSGNNRNSTSNIIDPAIPAEYRDGLTTDSIDMQFLGDLGLGDTYEVSSATGSSHSGVNNDSPGLVLSDSFGDRDFIMGKNNW
ncbi:hypothetical protein FOA43_001272 [Brettanomyces nanus]|uniref:Xylanolytic transcriptional activator regulatory domain-containing protein n=1 Tax=Eeniella nana TaxID=13502 RepID=A0A875RTX4_EENNA|nr:uncharacterized protein FOA43_001272 [Brettanomyces nanus]QPG73957.1 hypothetical protein FOA43_001272 [Brettanomyces nanus]